MPTPAWSHLPFKIIFTAYGCTDLAVGLHPVRWSFNGRRSHIAPIPGERTGQPVPGRASLAPPPPPPPPASASASKNAITPSNAGHCRHPRIVEGLRLGLCTPIRQLVSTS